jgi:hypothetical protein
VSDEMHFTLGEQTADGRALVAASDDLSKVMIKVGDWAIGMEADEFIEFADMCSALAARLP